MEESINIRYYNIQECGLYDGNNFKFGTVGDVLQQLTAWYNEKAKDKPFSHRKTHEQLDDLLPAYCFSIIRHKNKELYLLTLWNETTQNDGSIFSISNDSIGYGENLTINETNLPDDSIPGFATYFLFSPNQNKVAVIKFKHTALIGKLQLEYFLQNFIAKQSKYVVFSKNDNNDYDVLGFRDEKIGEPLNLRAKFKISVLRLPTAIEKIIDKCGDIRQMIIHKTIPNPARNNKSFLTVLSNLLTNVEYKAQNHDLHVKTEINILPTVNELQQTINNWLDEQREHNENLGFKFKGVSEPIWVNNMIAKQEEVIEVTKLNNEIITSESLFKALVGVVKFPD